METNTNNTADILEKIERLKKIIWERRPILGDIMRRHGSDTLYKYARDFMDVNPIPYLSNRKHELISVAKMLIAERLGPAVAERVARQLTVLPLVSTTDHHALVQHPFFLNANIISALPYLENHNLDVQFLIVFSFSSISVNNASGFPRGVLFHGLHDDAKTIIRLPLLPDRAKMSVVYQMRSITKDEVEKAVQQLERTAAEAGRGTMFEKMIGALREYFLTDDVLTAGDFSAQITKINFHLWPKLFHGAGVPQSMGTVPDLVYLEIETLVRELLLQFHINNSASLIYKVLFDPAYQALLLKYFNNLPGAFSLEKDWGTHLFWAIDNKHHRVKLFLKDGRLLSAYPDVFFDFTPTSVEQALRNGKIFPSMLLCYLIVSLYYGMKCLGGFSQVHDLTMIKEAWGNLLKDVNELKEHEALQPVQTKELGGDGMVLSYMRQPSGDIFPATAFDMLLSKENTNFDVYAKLSKKFTMEEIMNPMLPEIYTVLYSLPERDQALATLSPEEISNATGLREKIKKELLTS